MKSSISQPTANSEGTQIVLNRQKRKSKGESWGSKTFGEGEKRAEEEEEEEGMESVTSCSRNEA